MQPWQSILLILITLIGFGFGFYYDQVKKNSFAALENSYVHSAKENIIEENSSSDSKSNILQNSSAWAETRANIELPYSATNLIHLHKEALEGEVFLNLTLSELNQSPTAKEMIFSPFLNDIFIEPEKEILMSLFSIVQNINQPNRLSLLVRGHSQKASVLLSKLILETYQRHIENESIENPIHPELSDQQQKILMLEENHIKLATQIQEENQNSEVQSIEEIAIRSELMQITTELKSHKRALLDIETIHRTQEDPSEYLTIYSLANFGNVEDIVNKIDQLKTMIVNQELADTVKLEVSRNLSSLEQSLNQELANGIEQIKQLTKDAIKKKANLHKKLSDLEVKKNDLHIYHPRFKLLRALKSEIDQKKAVFRKNYKQWVEAKKGLSFKKAS